MRRMVGQQQPSSVPDTSNELVLRYANHKTRLARTSALWRLLAGMLLLASLLTGCGGSGTVVNRPASKITPTAAGDQATLYAAFAAGYLVALRASDGTLRWRIKGYTWPPVVANGMFYTESGTDLLAVWPAADGVATIWRASLDTGLMSAPVLREGILYVNSSGLTTDRAAPNGSVYAVDAHTGRTLWRFQTHGSMFSAPVVTADAVYTSAETSNLTSTLFALNRADGSPRWHEERNGYLSTLAVLGETLYAGSTDATIEALRTGDGVTVWSHQTQGFGNSLAVSDAGVVYAGSSGGNLYALRASDGSRVWAYQAGAPLLVPVAVKDGLVYVASENGYFAALDATTGKIHWRTCVDTTTCGTSGARIRFSPTLVSKQTIYVGVGFVGAIPSYGGLAQVAGGIYALDANTGRIRWQYQSGIVGAAMGTPALVGV